MPSRKRRKPKLPAFSLVWPLVGNQRDYFSRLAFQSTERGLAVAFGLDLAFDLVPFELAAVLAHELVAVPFAGDRERNRVVLERRVGNRRFHDCYGRRSRPSACPLPASAWPSAPGSDRRTSRSTSTCRSGRRRMARADQHQREHANRQPCHPLRHRTNLPRDEERKSAADAVWPAHADRGPRSNRAA